MRKHYLTLALLTGSCCIPLIVGAWIGLKATSEQALANIKPFNRVTLHAFSHGYAAVNLCDCVALSAAHSGAVELQQLLKPGLSQPRMLDSADFDEDGVPDLLVAYAQPDRGALGLFRGNVDSIYPNSPDAQRRKARGEFDDSAFLSPVRSFELAHPPDFLAVGDFDADGHWDAMVASGGSKSLYFLAGYGQGDFAPARQISLPGTLTTLISGEINRGDGLADIIVGLVADDGPRVMVFEGPEGAVQARPEVVDLRTEAKALALGRFDDDSLIDLAVAAGREVMVAHGRDKQTSLDQQKQAKVLPARISRHSFAFDINAIAVGDFSGTHQTSLALLSSGGAVYLASLEPPQNQDNKTNKEDTRSDARVIGRWPGASRLLAARVSVGASDDLLILEKTGHQLHIYDGDNSSAAKESAALMALQGTASLHTESEPIAALPMRLNGDALSDLVILQSDRIAPAIIKTASAMTYTVNTADDHDDGVCDSGDCSLREAVNASNANPGADTIAFAMGSGVQTIILSTDLPIITDAVTIDGTTQPGFMGSPIVEIDGTNADNRAGFHIIAGTSIVRGLVLNRFSASAVALSTNGGNRIEGNFIGTDVAGTTALFNGAGVSIASVANNTIGGTVVASRNVISGNGGNGVEVVNEGPSENLIQGNYIGTTAAGNAILGNLNFAGVFAAGTSNNTIGGTAPGAGNVISGNGRYGVELGGSGGHLVQGNLIGTNAAGTAAIPNEEAGVFIVNARGKTIGGTTPGARNIISGNTSSGIKIAETGSRDNLVQGNLIGTTIDGTTPLPNGTYAAGNSVGGIFINRGFDNTIGGATSSSDNIIAFNGVVGVIVIDDPPGVINTGNSIQRNSIFSNNGPGIDLRPFGLTPNDPCDADVGANNLQNFPVLTAATSNRITTTIQGTLNSTPNTAFTVEFFANDTCDPSGFGEGQTFIGSTTVTTDGSCSTSFSATFTVAVRSNQVISATATDPAGNTSEFSQCTKVMELNPFDFCLQDDSNGNILLVNLTTRNYLFTSCNGLVLTGTAVIVRKGCSVTLQVNGPDRRVLARMDTCRKTGTASVQALSQGMTFLILDRDITDNSCTCTTVKRVPDELVF